MASRDWAATCAAGLISSHKVGLCLLSVLGGALIAGSGCRAHPDDVRHVPSPLVGLDATMETFYGQGAPAADYSRLFVTYARHGRRDRRVVLGGEYLQESAVRWITADHLVVCIAPGAITNEFRNNILLETDTSVTLHTELREDCEADAYPRATDRHAIIPAPARSTEGTPSLWRAKAFAAQSPIAHHSCGSA